MVEMRETPQKKIQIEPGISPLSAFRVFLVQSSLQLLRHGQFGLPRLHFVDCFCSHLTSLDEESDNSPAPLEEFYCIEGFPWLESSCLFT